jgi:hypothetical protein
MQVFPACRTLHCDQVKANVRSYPNSVVIYMPSPPYPKETLYIPDFRPSIHLLSNTLEVCAESELNPFFYSRMFQPAPSHLCDLRVNRPSPFTWTLLPGLSFRPPKFKVARHIDLCFDRHLHTALSQPGFSSKDCTIVHFLHPLLRSLQGPSAQPSKAHLRSNP